MSSKNELISRANDLIKIIDDLLRIVRNEIDNGNSDKCNFDEVNDLFEETLELSRIFFKKLDEFYKKD